MFFYQLSTKGRLLLHVKSEEYIRHEEGQYQKDLRTITNKLHTLRVLKERLNSRLPFGNPLRRSF